MSASPTHVHVDRRAIVRRRRIPAALLLLAVFCCGTLFADRVEIKTGEVFFGKILRANRREVSVRLESGGIISFRMSQVAYFRKNFVASDDWINSPVLEIDDPIFFVMNPANATSFQGSPLTPVEGPNTFDVAGTDLSLVRPAVQVSRGFRVSPPLGFLDWEKPDGSSVKRFYDPVTQASLDITNLGPAKESLRLIKKRAASAHAIGPSVGRTILQDKQVRDAPYKGWYFEFREEAGGSSTHQIWLFAKGKNEVLLLKYWCPTEHFDGYRRSFAESIRSFSPTEAVDVEPIITTPEPPENPRGRLGQAEELLRLLRERER